MITERQEIAFRQTCLDEPDLITLKAALHYAELVKIILKRGCSVIHEDMDSIIKDIENQIEGLNKNG